MDEEATNPGYQTTEERILYLEDKIKQQGKDIVSLKKQVAALTRQSISDHWRA